MNSLRFIAIAFAIVAFCSLLWAWWDHSHWRRTIADFRKTFPGKCLLCSYYRYGLNYGYDAKPPGEHVCPEKQAAT